ncbi:MAG: biotin/lipoyl-binding protein, partial [Pirellulaceae bacterium]|nr:biotin/lipoyl-binding protein [Pirellulaceae bacterium]
TIFYEVQPMAIEIKLPDLGDGIYSGDILEILVQEGDIVAVDQSVIELETDKATVDVPSTHAGTVTKILVKAGQTVAIGDPILSLEGTAADTSTAPPPRAGPGAGAGGAARRPPGGAGALFRPPQQLPHQRHLLHHQRARPLPPTTTPSLQVPPFDASREKSESICPMLRGLVKVDELRVMMYLVWYVK